MYFSLFFFAVCFLPSRIFVFAYDHSHDHDHVQNHDGYPNRDRGRIHHAYQMTRACRHLAGMAEWYKSAAPPPPVASSGAQLLLSQLFVVLKGFRARELVN